MRARTLRVLFKIGLGVGLVVLAPHIASRFYPDAEEEGPRELKFFGGCKK